MNTGPVVSSVILFVNAQELRQSLNEKFREKHPTLPPSLTLSKIRNIKKSALLGCLHINIEVSTVALAVIYFEQLCLKGLVTKTNRHLTMAVSLVLAHKFNEPVTARQDKKRLEALLDFFDREWSIPKKEVFEAEFGAFVLLDFHLDAPYPHVLLVFLRLLKLAHKTVRSYLGDDMIDEYNRSIIMLEREKERSRERDRERERERELEKEQQREREREQKEDSKETRRDNNARDQQQQQQQQQHEIERSTRRQGQGQGSQESGGGGDHEGRGKGRSSNSTTGSGTGNGHGNTYYGMRLPLRVQLKQQLYSIPSLRSSFGGGTRGGAKEELSTTATSNITASEVSIGSMELQNASTSTAHQVSTSVTNIDNMQPLILSSILPTPTSTPTSTTTTISIALTDPIDSTNQTSRVSFKEVIITTI